MSIDTLTLTATEAARMLADGEASSEELATAYLDRIDNDAEFRAEAR